MNAQIITAQRSFFCLYEDTKKRLAELPPQQLQIIASEADDLKTTSRLYSEQVAADLVKTACNELLERHE
jgi:hypothetical protein